MEKVVILIFTHKAEPDPYEEASFRQCFEVLGKHPIRLVCPQGMDISRYRAIAPGVVPDFLDPKWFRTMRDYNLLKVLPWLYRRYAGYEFMLTYELDAWVFRDELLEWCDKGWDYIGAPWFANYSRATENDPFLGVGNSGFSLRSIPSALRAFSQRRTERVVRMAKDVAKGRMSASELGMALTDAEKFYAPFEEEYVRADDMFWHFEVARKYAWFKLPTPEEASGFAFESNPRRLYRETGNKLPFGCHKWRLREPDFWREHIPFPTEESYREATPREVVPLRQKRGLFSRLKGSFGVRIGRPALAQWFAPWRTLRRVLGVSLRPIPLPQCRKILVIRPDELGDVVMTSAFLRELRAMAPQAEISICTKPVALPLVEMCPYIDKAWSLPFRIALEPIERARLVWAVMKSKPYQSWRGYDAVLLPRVDADRCCAELAAHLLAGRGTVWMNSPGFIRYTSAVPEGAGVGTLRYVCREAQSEVLTNLEFLEWCSGRRPESAKLEVWTSQRDEEAAQAWLQTHFPCRLPLVVFHPSGGNNSLKLWPLPKFRELVSHFLEEGRFNVLIVGGQGEVRLKAALDLPACERLAYSLGELSLRQLACVFRSARLFVGGDSGPMHLASAAGAPVVGIFGPASLKRFHPTGPRSEAVSLSLACNPDQVGSFEANCVSCIHAENRCLTELPVESVLAAAKRMLAA